MPEPVKTEAEVLQDRLFREFGIEGSLEAVCDAAEAPPFTLCDHTNLATAAVVVQGKYVLMRVDS